MSEFTQLREREVDDPVLAREGHGRLGADAGEERQALALTTSEDDGQRAAHVPMLHGSPDAEVAEPSRRTLADSGSRRSS